MLPSRASHSMVSLVKCTSVQARCALDELVAKTLPNAVLNIQKSSIYAGFRRFCDYSHSIVATGLSLKSQSTRLTPGTSQITRSRIV